MPEDLEPTSDAAMPGLAPVGRQRTSPPVRELSTVDRRAARQLLGAIFITAGIAHLTHQRFYRTMVPTWLLHARHEIDTVTGVFEVFGGVVLFVPKLRGLARWTNLMVLAPAAPAVMGEMRRPYRYRPYTRQRVGLQPIGPMALAPAHAGLAGLLWWATAKD